MKHQKDWIEERLAAVWTELLGIEKSVEMMISFV